MNIDLQARQIQPLRQTFARVAAYTGGSKPASRYQEATLAAQSTHHFHYRPTWEPEFELFDTGRTAIVMSDWNLLRDPRQFYYATWTMTRARQQETMESNYQFVESRGMVDRMPDTLRTMACEVLMPLRHVAWAGNMNNCQITSRGYGTPLTAPALMHALDHLAVAQFLTRLGLVLQDAEQLESGKQDWLEKAHWQPLRRYVEDLLVKQDPMELFVAQNLVLDGLLYPLIFTRFVDDQLSVHGGAAVAMMTSFMPEWHAESASWVDAVIKVCAGESDANREQLTRWYAAHVQAVCEALAPLATQALAEYGESILSELRDELDSRVRPLGLSV